MPNWKKIIVSGSDAQLNSLSVTNAVTASVFSGSFSGSLFGTASWAQSSSRATTSSYALTASYINPLNQNVSIFGNLSVSGSTFLSASSNNIALQLYGSGSTIFSISGSSNEIFRISDDGTSTNLFSVSSGSTTILSINSNKVVSISGSLVVTGSITGSLFGTASWAYSASQAVSSSYALTSSYSLSSSYAVSSSYSVSSSYALSSSYSLSSSFATTSSYSATASYVNPLNQTVYITGSLIVSNSLNVIGTDTTTGSVYITGSSTLIGNSVITGSILMTGSGYISKVEYIDFSITGSETYPTHQEGRVHWLDDTKTLQIDTDVNSFMIELGHQSVVRVRNTYGFTLSKGKIVYINGESGNRPTVATASWEGDSTSAGTMGWVAQDIAASQTGYVVTNGMLRNINTNAYAPGTPLYLSSSGNWTSTAPDAPYHEVRLGKVITQATAGTIYVNVMNGYELTELHDVQTTTYNDGDLLIRSNSLWTNSKILTGSYTLSGSLSTNDGVWVQSLTASFVSASSITGSLFGTASFITGSIFTSTNPALSASYALSSSLAESSSYSLTASYLIGSVASAAQIETTATDANGTYYVTLVGTSPVSATAQTVYTDSTSLTYNPSTNALTVVSVTGSLFGLATSASIAATASFVTSSNVYGPNGPNSIATASFVTSIKSGVVSTWGGSGNANRTGSVTFTTPYPNTSYSVTVTGGTGVARSWTIDTKTTTGFIINSNSNTNITGEANWIAVPYNS